jgi:hypothetical protein
MPVFDWNLPSVVNVGSNPDISKPDIVVGGGGGGVVVNLWVEKQNKNKNFLFK